jgi:hypothetical protein
MTMLPTACCRNLNIYRVLSQPFRSTWSHHPQVKATGIAHGCCNKSCAFSRLGKVAAVRLRRLKQPAVFRQIAPALSKSSLLLGPCCCGTENHVSQQCGEQPRCTDTFLAKSSSHALPSPSTPLQSIISPYVSRTPGRYIKLHVWRIAFLL